MDFRFTPAQDAFRQELRDFLADLPPTHDAEGEQFLGHSDREFSKKVAQRGWIGLPWPKEYGGADLGYMERAIFTEEMCTANAPMAYHFITDRQMGPTIIRHGSEEQKRTLIPPILRGELSICIGMSEPEAGSDLANVKTRAVRDGDDYVINGQKIWTSHGHEADMIMLVARTNPDVPKHKGISLIMVDMKSPGVSVRPLVNMTNVHAFNEIFFEDVRVPRKNLVGEEDAGWYILAENLDFERGGIERVAQARYLLDDILEFMKTAPDLPGGSRKTLAAEVAERAIEYEVGRLLCYRVAWLFSNGGVPNYEASMSKVYGSEWCKKMGETAMHVLAAYGLGATAEQRELARRIQDGYMTATSTSIQGGTSEVQRNIIATRGLGLPR